MFRLIVPVSNVDFQRAGLMLGRMHALGLKDRLVTLVCTWEDKFDVEELHKQFSAVYPLTTELAILPDVPDGDWPPNHMFFQTCMWLYAHKNEQPFYFFEADNFPLYAGWDVEMDEEYVKSGMPYMGYKNISRFQENGKTVVRGEHMVGTGIYPANFLSICEAVHSLGWIPWDLECQDEILPYCHATQKIHHAWSTGGYHLKEGKLIAEPRNPWNRYGGPVSPTAVVIHGCKDDSLYRLTIPPRELPS